MKQRVANALEVCLQALDTGVELETCLTLYPDMESDLRPVLEAHSFAQMISAPDPPSLAVDKSRRQMLARAQELHQQKTTARFPRAATAILIVALLFLFGGGTILAASAAAIPGDTLYALKLKIEEASIDLAPGQPLKDSLQETHTKRRLEEIQKLITLEREEKLSFEGVITAIGTDGLFIDDIAVSITDKTNILGSFAEGDRVEIFAVVRDGIQLEALQLKLRSYRLNDIVVSISDEHWVVGDLRLRIDALTLIEHGVQVGERVLVLVRIDDEGSAYAQAILREVNAVPAVLTTATEPVSSESATPEAHEIRFSGVVQEMRVAFWRIGDVNVLITERTAIDDGIALGDMVRVNALVFENGAVRAREIVLRELATERPRDESPIPEITPLHTPEPTDTPVDEDDKMVIFSAILEEKAGDRWFIGGEIVIINDQSEIFGEPEIGDLLHVEAFVGRFGRLIALRIELISD